MMGAAMRKPRRIPSVSRGRCLWRQALGSLLILGVCFVTGTPSQALAIARKAEVRNLGLSRLGERTTLTVLLDRIANPRISPYLGKGRSQLIIDFPQAGAGKLPETLVGDEVLVKQVRSEVSEDGVKIILEMFADRPYIYKREMSPLSGGGAMLRVTMWADPRAPAPARPPAALPAPGEPLAPRAPEPQVLPPEQIPSSGRSEPPPAVTPAPQEPVVPPAVSAAPTGTFAELYQLMPQAKDLWDFLRGEGWTVAKAQSYNSPGTRASRGFSLTNDRYPELKVRIAHLPPTSSGSPSISIVDLSMENLSGRTPNEYRNLRQWNFAKIKTKYEDIGDFFDDALKPLRVDIRKECQSLARRHAQFITNFLGKAVPQNPKLANEALTLIQKKVSPRFEGVQYTLSENPLIILNLVDFLFIRVYFIGR
jgi:hypothetical protein